MFPEDVAISWQTGCPCSGAFSWRWTAPSCLLCSATALRTPEGPTWSGWSSLGCGQAQEGENLHRAGQPARQSSVGGPGWKGWRPVVGGDQAVPDPSGQSPSLVRAHNLAEKGRTGVEAKVSRSAIPPEFSQIVCWGCDTEAGRMGMPPPPMLR